MKDIKAVTDWYQDNRPLYESLAQKAEDIIKENLQQKGIQFHSVTSRAKSLDSFNSKAGKDKYSNPIQEIKDMAGIRVITYLESDVPRVAATIEELFYTDRKNSFDQSQLLGSDKLGYRSVHYVAKFGARRCKLPEYKVYKGLPFEIQIRSILQHAWAEIEHDRNYKFNGKLPTPLERRFYLVAGMLEVADKEFSSIADYIEKYRANVTEELEKGDLDIEINTTSLREYLSKRFAQAIENRLLSANFGRLSKDIVDELRLFGISRLYQLEGIIPTGYQDYMLTSNYYDNFAGLTRNLLIIKDAARYFDVCWEEKWKIMGKSDRILLERYGVDTNLMEKYIQFESFDF